MKKLIFILLVGTAVSTSCGGASNHSNTKDGLPKVISLSKADFIEKIYDYPSHLGEWNYLGDKPAIIDFYADWCAPCKLVSPILEELAIEYVDQVYFYKINTDKEKELANLFGIKAIPSLLFISLDDIPQMVQGAFPKEVIQEHIDVMLLQDVQ